MYTWNAMTADEPDPVPEMESRMIESRIEDLMGDFGWVESVLDYGGLTDDAMINAITASYGPEYHSRIGGLLVDILLRKAQEEATEWVKNKEYLDV